VKFTSGNSGCLQLLEIWNF